MNTGIRKWLPLVLCCLPGIVAVALVGLGSAAFSATLSGPLGWGLIVLAALACPLSMLILMRMPQRNLASGGSPTVADCCMPGHTTAHPEADLPSERLAALRQRREALEHELAALQDGEV